MTRDKTDRRDAPVIDAVNSEGLNHVVSSVSPKLIDVIPEKAVALMTET